MRLPQFSLRNLLLAVSGVAAYFGARAYVVSQASLVDWFSRIYFVLQFFAIAVSVVATLRSPRGSSREVAVLSSIVAGIVATAMAGESIYFNSRRSWHLPPDYFLMLVVIVFNVGLGGLLGSATTWLLRALASLIRWKR